LFVCFNKGFEKLNLKIKSTKKITVENYQYHDSGDAESVL
jgi:hypothetical protein